MTGWLLPMFLVALAVSAAVTPAIRNIAVRLRILDNTHDLRRVHGRPVPRIGGIAIIAGFSCALMVGLVRPETRAVVLSDGWAILSVVIAGGLVALVGLYDDLMGAGAPKKLAVQIAAGLLLYASGFRLDSIGLGLNLSLGPFALPCTLLWTAGVANAMNLIDGLDGLAAGIALLGAGAAFVIGCYSGDLATVAMAVALSGSVGGFLLYNRNPASIFMGDCGSLFLGTVLAALALRPDAARGYVPVIATAVVLGVPVADMVLAIARRSMRGAPLFIGDREHLHHRLLDRGLSPRAAVSRLWAASAVLAAAGSVIACSRDLRTRVGVLGFVALGAVAALHRVGAFSWAAEAPASRRRRNRERLRAIRCTGATLRDARDVTDVHRAVAAVAPLIGARSVRLRIRRQRVAPGRTSPGHSPFYPLEETAPHGPGLEIEWHPEHRLERDVEIAIEIFAKHVEKALVRLSRHDSIETFGARAPGPSRSTVVFDPPAASGNEA